MQSASDEWNPPVKLQQSNSERGLRGMAPNNLPSPRNRICVSCYKEKYFEKLKSFSRSKSVVPGTTNSPQSTTKKPPNHHQKTPTFPKNPCKNPLSRSEKNTRKKKRWWRRRESNPRPKELPTESLHAFSSSFLSRHRRLERTRMRRRPV